MKREFHLLSEAGVLIWFCLAALLALLIMSAAITFELARIEFAKALKLIPSHENPFQTGPHKHTRHAA